MLNFVIAFPVSGRVVDRHLNTVRHTMVSSLISSSYTSFKCYTFTAYTYNRFDFHIIDLGDVTKVGLMN